MIHHTGDVILLGYVGLGSSYSDGLCGVCATPFDAAQSDAVQHRDFVLSAADRSHKIILCCSRTAEPDKQIVLDL